jgi:EmrB/QacA subfamily drug resistance transporter
MDRKWWTLIAVCVGTFMLLLDVTIVNVALPAIQSSLKANFSDLQWVVDAYSLLLAALLLTTGSLADLYGRKRVFIIGLVIFSLSSLASGLAQTPLWLNLARGAQGIGGAAMFSTSLALLGSAFQGRERGTAFGAWGAITGLAVAIGPVVGGALTTGISWRWIFLVNVPIGVVAVVVTMLRVEESRQPGNHRVDPIGVITFTGSLGALVYALIKANEKGWGSTLILALLAGALVGMILFVIAELVQKDRAMFDLALFRKPTFTGGSIAAFSLSAGFFALFLYLTLYLQDLLGYSALQTGLRFLVLSGGILLTSTLAGRLTAFVPIRFLIAPGLALVGIGLLLMRGVNAGTHWEHLIPGFIVAGAGVGLINPPLASTAIGVVTPNRAGMASGINSTFRQVGIATGIAGLGTLFAHTVSTHIESALRGTPGVSTKAAHALANTVSQGSGAASGLGALPAKARPAAAHAVRASFTTGLNEVFLVGALLTLVSAVLTLILIRSRDFEASAARSESRPEAGEPAEQPPAGEQPEAEQPEAERPPATASSSADEGPGEELVRSAEAVISAVGQASRDYERQVEQGIERHRAAELGAAEAQSGTLLSDAMDRNERYAERMRRRVQDLDGERERLMAELRRQTRSLAGLTKRLGPPPGSTA